MTIIDHLQTIGNAGHHLTMRELKPLSGVAYDSRSVFWPTWERIGVEQRRAIIHAMVELSEDNADLDFSALLLWCLDDQDADIRQQAVDGLWEHESPRLLRRLLDLLQADPSLAVRESAAISLSRFAYEAELGELSDADAERVHTALMVAAQDPAQSFDVRRRALESAGYFANDPKIEQLVAEAYASSEQLLRESALVAMGRSMLPRWLPIIKRELTSASPALRYEAARAAGEMAEEARSLLPQLVPLCRDDDPEIALASIWALGQIGGSAAQRVLNQLRKDQDDARRQAAIDALEELTLEDGLFTGKR